MPQNTKHSDYDKWESIWERIRDSVEGYDAIKNKGNTYLPMLNGQDVDFYNAYKKRSQYVDFPSELIIFSALYRVKKGLFALSDQSTNTPTLFTCNISFAISLET